jgi:RNA polymerase sigma-70 factor (ECF subfamily)
MGAEDFDPELVRRAIAGDAAARTDLWRTHRRAVAAVVLAHRRLDAAAPDLEDLMQEVALRLCRHLGELREPQRFEPWLMQIARNVARESARRGSVRAVVRPLDDAAEPLVAAAADARVAGADLADALARLPDDLREPLVLRCVEGLPQRRIAELLGLPETTIETRLVRARRLLRERLEPSDDRSLLRIRP